MAILREGSNCWKLSQADRVAFLVDGSAYFRALSQAICHAKKNLIVIGWDISSDTTLRRDQPSGGDRFVDFLFECANRETHLNIYLLSWDYAWVYMFERKLFPALSWSGHPKIHFFQDYKHPTLGSHHQKIVVVDDSIAFVGGFDIAAERWDTRNHWPHDPRRMDAEGKLHGPIHDIQVAVEGDAARDLGMIARTRWERATNQWIPLADRNLNVWPENLIPHFKKIEIGISRTIPIYDSPEEEIREVEQLYLDSIAAARKYIYVENQYFTSSIIGDALASRLKEENGPEIVLVLHRDYGGLMEWTTMATMRKKVLMSLKRENRYGRLGVFYPLQKNFNVGINVHSKLMIVDDSLVHIGSSNLTNRSLGLDTECDIGIEARDANDRDTIARFRNGLLAEHLGSTTEAIAAEIEQRGSLLSTIDALRNETRTLDPIEEDLPEWLEKQIPDNPFFDPVHAMPLYRRFGKWLLQRKKFVGTAAALLLTVLFFARQARK